MTSLHCPADAPPVAATIGAVCRLLPWRVADGVSNMAADEGLLEAAAAGIASLRFYAWSRATLSLGYFQPHASRHNPEVLGDLPYVRRPSGGDALIHEHEVTYTLAIPAQPPWQSEKPAAWLCRLHAAIRSALSELGVTTRSCTEDKRLSNFLCFGHHTSGDVLIGNAKVVGSAQRRLRGAVMQHGAILLAGSAHTPSLPGIRDLTGVSLEPELGCRAIVRALTATTGWKLEPADWSTGEQERNRALAETKYCQASWNDKR